MYQELLHIRGSSFYLLYAAVPRPVINGEFFLSKGRTVPVTATCIQHMDGDGNWIIYFVFIGTTPYDMDFWACNYVELKCNIFYWD